MCVSPQKANTYVHAEAPTGMLYQPLWHPPCMACRMSGTWTAVVRRAYVWQVLGDAPAGLLTLLYVSECVRVCVMNVRASVCACVCFVSVVDVCICVPVAFVVQLRWFNVTIAQPLDVHWGRHLTGGGWRFPAVDGLLMAVASPAAGLDPWPASAFILPPKPHCFVDRWGGCPPVGLGVKRAGSKKCDGWRARSAPQQPGKLSSLGEGGGVEILFLESS